MGKSYEDQMEDEIKKGGVGSGIKGHMTNHPELHSSKVKNLATKLGEPPAPFKAHLHMLENGAVMEGVNLRSGKPLFLKHDQAIAHGYTSQEHREAANVFYEHAQKMSEAIDKMKLLKKPVPSELTKIVQFHRQAFRRHMSAADRVENTRKQTEAALDKKKKDAAEFAKVKKSDVDDFMEKASKRIKPEDADRCVRRLVGEGVDLGMAYAKCTGKRRGMKRDPLDKLDKCECEGCATVSKSVVMLGHQDGAEIDTGKYANELASALHTDWLGRMVSIMEGYQYGELPRLIMLDRGNLHLVKVGDGIYTGSFAQIEETDEGALIDNAKTRIERMSLPSIVHFCMAKEWITPYTAEMELTGSTVDSTPEQVKPPKDPVPVNEIFAAPGPDAVESADSVKLDRRIHILELLAKLTT